MMENSREADQGGELTELSSMQATPLVDDLLYFSPHF